jgi:hypothetical protein
MKYIEVNDIIMDIQCKTAEYLLIINDTHFNKFMNTFRAAEHSVLQKAACVRCCSGLHIAKYVHLNALRRTTPANKRTRTSQISVQYYSFSYLNPLRTKLYLS